MILVVTTTFRRYWSGVAIAFAVLLTQAVRAEGETPERQAQAANELRSEYEVLSTRFA
jgi:hypothetical protein